MFRGTECRQQHEIKALKTARKAALKTFKQKNLVKNERLAEYFFYKFKEGKDVPYELLKSAPIGEALLLPVVYGGAIITIKEYTANPLESIYSTKWTAGSTLTMHYHSDCTEVMEIKKGSAKVYVKGSTHVLKVGDKLEVGINIAHQITALEESELKITFKQIL